MDGQRYLFDFIASLKGDKKVVTGMQQMEAQQRKLVRITQQGANVTEVYSAKQDKQGKVMGKSTTFVRKQGAVVQKYTQSVDKSGKVTEKFGQTIDKTGTSAMNFGGKFANIAKRALLTIPTWLLLRTVFMGIIRTVGDMIRAFVDLDDQLARIRTVMHGDARVIEAEMFAIRSQILETAVDSRIALKDLSEGFYFLKTANLDAREAMAGFEHTVNLAIGTTNSMAQSARAVAGIYNTMGKYLGDTLTIHEKFQHIADVLAYTYSTQDVQLSELIQSYTKLAPYVTGLSDSFLELTTMLGFLNTRLLRGGRTGRLTGRAILQLSKNSQKLAGIFGITFDPDKPIALLDTVEKIRDMMGKTGKITAEQGQLIQEVFATRGGVAIRLLIEHFDDLNDQIKDAIENSDGFAEKMKEIRMRTISGQMQRMKNILGVLATEFINTAYGASNLADMLDELNDDLVTQRINVKGLGDIVSWLGDRYRQLTYVLYGVLEARKQMRQIEEATGRVTTPIADIGRAVKETRKLWDLDRKNREERDKNIAEYKRKEEELKKLYEEEVELQKKLSEFITLRDLKGIEETEKRIKEIREEQLKLSSAEVQLSNIKSKNKEELNLMEEEGLGLMNKGIEYSKHQIRLMKIIGASALEIVRQELEILEKRVAGFKTIEDEVKILEARNKVIEEEVRYSKELTTLYYQSELRLLKLMGATELQILEAKERQLLSSIQSLSPETKKLALLKLQLEQIEAEERARRKEKEAVQNFLMIYHKAGTEEKARLKRLTELMRMGEFTLVKQYQEDAYDRSIVDQYFKYFSDKQKEAITEAHKKMYPELREALDVIFEEQEIEVKIKTILPEAEIQQYAIKWEEAMKQSADRFAEYFKTSISMEEETKQLQIPTPADINEWVRKQEDLRRKQLEAINRYVQEAPKIVQQIPTPDYKPEPIIVKRDIKIDINVENVEAKGLTKEEVSETFIEEILRILESDEVKDKIDKGLGGTTGLRG